MKVFIDTSAFIALFITNEELHQKCKTKYRAYNRSHTFFYTSYFVLAELYTRLMHDYGVWLCKKAITQITQLRQEGKLRVFQVDPTVFLAAEQYMIKFADHLISYTDANTYSLMKTNKLDEVFTLDEDFAKIGLQTSF